MTTILVLTNSKDGKNSEAVINSIINSGNSVIRFDVDKFTSGVNSLSWSYHHSTSKPILEVETDTYDLSNVGAAWFRRPYYFDFQINDPVQRQVAEEETRDVLDGLFAFLEDKFWVSRPSSIGRARLKPFQLHAARKAGLKTADTLITNSPANAREFCSQKTVFKPMAGYHFDYKNESRTAFTTIIGEEYLDQLDLVRSQPVLLQRWIPKQFEIRATFVGDKLFAVKIEADNYKEIVDWRLPDHTNFLRYKEYRLPKDVEKSASRLVKSLGLQYAALDFAVDIEDNHFFLEINPVGQWLWIEDLTGLPISSAIASLLVSKGGEK